MCNLGEAIVRENMAKGMARGRVEGRAEGIANGIITSIKNLMKNTGGPVEQAMATLGAPKDSQKLHPWIQYGIMSHVRNTPST